jgi:hypothetical protein
LSKFQISFPCILKSLFIQSIFIKTEAII